MATLLVQSSPTGSVRQQDHPELICFHSAMLTPSERGDNVAGTGRHLAMVTEQLYRDRAKEARQESQGRHGPREASALDGGGQGIRALCRTAGEDALACGAGKAD